MGYQGDKAKVFVMNLETGQRQQVGDFPGETFAPRFSPDGQRLLMSVSKRARPPPSSKSTSARSKRAS